jgi:hypothetical protein
MTWARLGSVPPTALGAASTALHHAAQVVAAAGETFVPARPDTSQNASVWIESHAALGGSELPARFPCRIALRVADLTLLLLDRQGAPHAELALAGRTPAEALGWAADAIRSYTHGELARALVHPGFEIPGQLTRFPAPDAALAELGRWYASADYELGVLAARTPGAGPVLCWPHHFDIATLIELGAGRSVGVGLSPGDAGIPEPYLYVNHHPPHAGGSLPPLEAGAWHMEGWLGALLRGSELIAAGDAAAQRARWRRFVASAVAASRKLLSGSGP